MWLSRLSKVWTELIIIFITAAQCEPIHVNVDHFDFDLDLDLINNDKWLTNYANNEIISCNIDIASLCIYIINYKPTLILFYNDKLYDFFNNNDWNEINEIRDISKSKFKRRLLARSRRRGRRRKRKRGRRRRRRRKRKRKRGMFVGLLGDIRNSVRRMRYLRLARCAFPNINICRQRYELQRSLYMNYLKHLNHLNNMNNMKNMVMMRAMAKNMNDGMKQMGVLMGAKVKKEVKKALPPPPHININPNIIGLDNNYKPSPTPKKEKKKKEKRRLIGGGEMYDFLMEKCIKIHENMCICMIYNYYDNKISIVINKYEANNNNNNDNDSDALVTAYIETNEWIMNDVDNNNYKCNGNFVDLLLMSYTHLCVKNMHILIQKKEDDDDDTVDMEFNLMDEKKWKEIYHVNNDNKNSKRLCQNILGNHKLCVEKMDKRINKISLQKLLQKKQ